MKILQATAYFSPVMGGSAEVPYQLSSALIKRGHQVNVYTSDYKLDNTYINLLPAGTVRSFHTLFTAINFYITPGLMRAGKKEIRQYDIVHLHNYRTFQNIVIHHYAKKLGIPYIVQPHGSAGTFFMKGFLKKVFDITWGKRILNDASILLAVSSMEAEQLSEMGIEKSRINILPNGMDVSAFENLPRKGLFREKYSLKSDDRIVLFLGRIHKIKGISLLVQAFAELSAELGNINLVIAGPDDGDLPNITRLVKKMGIIDKVIFTGPLYGQEKLSAYIDADVFVLPSMYEIFSVTILESLLCGTPVIIVDQCGIAGDIDGKGGISIPRDKGSLKKAMYRMLTDHNLRKSLGARGKKLVQQRFNWTAIIDNLEKIYNNASTDREKLVDSY